MIRYLTRAAGAFCIAIASSALGADLQGDFVEGIFLGTNFGAYKVPYSVPICGQPCVDPEGQYTVGADSIDVFASGFGLSFYNSGAGGTLNVIDLTADRQIIDVTPKTYTFGPGQDGIPPGGTATATFTSNSVTIFGTGVWPPGSDANFHLHFGPKCDPVPPVERGNDRASSARVVSPASNSPSKSCPPAPEIQFLVCAQVVRDTFLFRNEISALATATETSSGRQVTLLEAAKRLGYTHFNWLQTIVQSPLLEKCASVTDPLSDKQCARFTDRTLRVPKPPTIDPPLGGWHYELDKNCPSFPVHDEKAYPVDSG